MLVKIGENYEPVMRIEDFERFIEPEIWEGMMGMLQQNEATLQEELQDCKADMDYYERQSDEYFQMINSALPVLAEFREFVKEPSNRITRRKIVDKLNEVINTLENY